MNKIFLRKEFFPAHEENRMHSEGDLKSARENFYNKNFSNLHYLLEQRYLWMNPFIADKNVVVELGAGAGFSRRYIQSDHLILSDYHIQDWIDMQVDAMNLPFEDSSVDCFICSHMIHHLYNPRKFFLGIQRALKSSGKLLIQEINTSLLMRFLLKLMRHEGWSYDVDVFDENTVANMPEDPFSANCAIPEMLFADSGHFEKEFPGLRIVKNSPCEFLIFPLSGGGNFQNKNNRAAATRFKWNQRAG